MVPDVERFEKFTLKQFFGGEDQENFTTEVAETNALITFIANDKDALVMFKFFAGLSQDQNFYNMNGSSNPMSEHKEEDSQYGSQINQEEEEEEEES
jgi:hypothetical protein